MSWNQNNTPFKHTLTTKPATPEHDPETCHECQLVRHIAEKTTHTIADAMYGIAQTVRHRHNTGEHEYEPGEEFERFADILATMDIDVLIKAIRQ